MSDTKNNGVMLKHAKSTVREPDGFDRSKAIPITEIDRGGLVYEIRSTRGNVLWRGIDKTKAIEFQQTVPLVDFING